MLEERNLRLPDVQAMTGLSKTEIYRRIADGKFPAQIRLSHRLAVWHLSAVQDWVKGLAK